MTLSDVTIRYGASEELTFEAHKLLLSAKSYWFEAAFTGGFAVGHELERKQHKLICEGKQREGNHSEGG